MNKNEIRCEFTVNADAFDETPIKKITGMRLIIAYENPQAYGYPEVCRWEQEFEFNIGQMRRKSL